MATITGTFTATGQSETIVGRGIDIAMLFGASTGSVDIERMMPSGAWLQVGASVTADYNEVAEYPANVSIRLNCTAVTGSIEYVMQTGSEG